MPRLWNKHVKILPQELRPHSLNKRKMMMLRWTQESISLERVSSPCLIKLLESIKWTSLSRNISSLSIEREAHLNLHSSSLKETCSLVLANGATTELFWMQFVSVEMFVTVTMTAWLKIASIILTNAQLKLMGYSKKVPIWQWDLAPRRDW